MDPQASPGELGQLFIERQMRLAVLHAMFP
jgi:hypothetical protein